MKTIEQIITEKFEEKINNGDFEKIINEKLDSLVKDTLNSLTGWSSPLKKQLEERLKPVLETAIANSNLDNILDKMTLLLNNVLTNSELKNASELQNNIEQYLTYSKREKYGDSIKLSEIFNKYVEFAKNECDRLDFDESDLDFDDGYEIMYFTTQLEEIQEEKKGYFSRYSSGRKFILKTIPNDYDESDNHEMPELDIEFEIDSLGYLNLCEKISVNRLTNYPAFIWFLIRLSQTFHKIEIDIDCKEEEIEVKVERSCD